MRTNISAIAFVCFCLSSAAFGQSAILKGKVVDDKENPVSNVRIITPDGQADVTDSKGQFTIAFPTTVQPGQTTRIELRDKPNWVIYEPMLGNCVIQNKERNFEPLKVIIVPKGSPLALSPKRLGQVIARWADERVRLRSQVKEQQSQLDEYAFLREYAKEYGITLEQFREAADQWANGKIAADKLEAGWQEYWKKNYDRAAQLGYESRITFQEKLKRDKEKRLEDGRQFIRSARLEGNARYAEDKFREAAAAYQAIEVGFRERELVREDFPAEWAANKNSLGNTKSALGERVEGKESHSLLAEAVDDFREALGVYTHEQLPQDWATTQSNLGVALSSQGERSSGEESVRLLAEAVSAYREALKVRTREQLPQDWAATQNNLGTALSSLGLRLSGEKGVRLLDKSVIAHREALKVYTREQLPLGWATTQNNLGNALRLLGERSSGEESVRLLTEAIAAYREALKVYTREQFRWNWAATQNNLGIALKSQSKQSSGDERVRLLAEAVTAFREALKVRTREQSPQHWASTQNNLGVALHLQSEWPTGEESKQLLAEAVTAFHEALKVRTRDTLPQDWAATQDNLGSALTRQGERLSGEERARLLVKAVSAYREALKVRTREQLPRDWAMTQNNLGGALMRQGQWLDGEGGVWLLAQSVTAFSEALKVFTPEYMPQDWAMTQNNLGMALSSHAERLSGEKSLQLLTQSVTAFREALKVYTHKQFPYYWAMTQSNLARAYYILKDWNNAAMGYSNMLTVFPSYEEVYQRLSTIYQQRVFEYGKAYALLDQWLRRFPEGASAQAAFAETHFTTGRFAEFSARLKPLLANPGLPAATKIALQMIEVANLLALDQAKEVPAKLDALIAAVAAQTADFQIDWSFAGTLHFINEQEKLAAHRVWLNQFFGTAQGADRDAILKTLRKAQAQFKPSAR